MYRVSPLERCQYLKELSALERGKKVTTLKRCLSFRELSPLEIKGNCLRKVSTFGGLSALERLGA